MSIRQSKNISNLEYRIFIYNNTKVEMKQCYYQLLQIDRKATSAQIKTNYRKLALKFHPDKNPTEEGRQKFLQITQAYEVLSDPNERTWYDNNRQKILFNKEEMSKEDVEMYSFGFNIWTYFTSACFKGFGDEEGGFYQVYRDVFEKVKVQEGKAFAGREDKDEEQMRKYQGFGDSKTILKRVLQFYDDWENFTTYKTFVWVDDYDTRDAPNRYVKRQMQKQNKKERQKQKKTYIKTIKDLVSFLKKRDPRYREYLLQQKKKEQERELQKKQKQEQKKKQKQEMKKIKQKLQEQRFKQIQQYYQKQQQSGGKNQTNVRHDESEQDGFLCVLCDKEFKSQNQLKNHENSKMHKQNLKLLEKQVMTKEERLQKNKGQVQKQEKQQEKQEPQKQKQPAAKKKRNRKNKNKNEELEKQEEEEITPVKEEPKKNQPIKNQPIKNQPKKNQSKTNQPNKKVQKVQKEQEEEEQVKKPTKNKKAKNKNKKQEVSQEQQQKNAKPAQKEKPNKKQETQKQQKKQAQSEQSDDHDAFMNAFMNKAKKVEKVQSIEEKPKKQGKAKKVQSSSQNSQEEQGDKKKGKAKQRRQKKQANKQKDTSLKCNVCAEVFSSKTKLFQHLNKSGHAKAK